LIKDKIAKITVRTTVAVKIIFSSPRRVW